MNAKQPVNSLKKASILVAEDTQSGQLYIADLLGDQVAVIFESDANGVLPTLKKRSESGSPLSAIVMDLALKKGRPEEGTVLIGEIRDTTEYRDLPIAVYTKHSEEYRTRAKAAGATEVFRKAVDDGLLKAFVLKVSQQAKETTHE